MPHGGCTKILAKAAIGPRGKFSRILYAQLASISSDNHIFIRLSLSRLNHGLPRSQAHAEVMQGTAEFHHEITDALLPETEPVFDDATALHTAVDVLDPQPTVVQRLVGHV